MWKMSEETQVTLHNESRAYAEIGEVEAVHTERVLAYINNPKNLEIMGDYDGKGEKSAKVGNQVVTVWIYLKIEGNVIRRATYFSDSLGGLIHAYGGNLTEVLKGKTIRDALWLQPEDISANLGLPETGFGAWYKAALVEAINTYNGYESAPWKKIYEGRC
jgi:NifU-like protein involved in Fe-S cluster formation